MFLIIRTFSLKAWFIVIKSDSYLFFKLFLRRFGFANPAALAAGETGVNCRGEEHDVTFVWSLTSGKRMVLADGQEVHFSNSRSNLFEFSWTMKGNNVLKIVAHASPPLSPTPGFRQYDFFINGQSFFTFPKVFRIGMSANDMRGVPSPSGSAQMAESSRRYGAEGASSRSANIANLEAPNNPDEVSGIFGKQQKPTKQRNFSGMEIEKKKRSKFFF
jgi:hypothetical protein